MIERIKKYDSWGKVQKSVWLIKTWDAHTQVRNELFDLMDADDRLMVIEVGATAAWKNQICDNDWLLGYLRR